MLTTFIPPFVFRSLRPPRLMPVSDGKTFEGIDTIPEKADVHGDAVEVIHNVLWQRSAFTVKCGGDTSADIAIHFPSPLPLGHARSDTVAMDWHVARDARGAAAHGPAVLVLDILNGGNLLTHTIARRFSRKGIHGFVMHMPFAGRRSEGNGPIDWVQFLPGLRQAVGDARRARDAIAALPLVREPIGIQGTSLGGFVATMAACIDQAFDPVLLALTGGNLFDMLSTGSIDAARVRAHLRAAGINDQKLRDWLWQVEPMRIAHRLDPNRTWLFSARFDQVVRPIFSRALAERIGLTWSHRRELAGCHYSWIVGARRFVSEMVAAVRLRNRSSG